MNIPQYMLDNKLNQKQLAKLCKKPNGESVEQSSISWAIKHNFIIINGTVYSPRFEIDESKLNEVKK